MQAIISTHEQGSDEWLAERIPYVTASNIAKVMAKGAGTTRQNYLVQKACEILSGKPVPGFKSKHMQNGNDNEQAGRELYQLITGNQVERSGFAYLPDEKLGASVDGLVSDDGTWEHKFVIPPEQVRFITTGKIKPEYVKQIQTQMYVRDRQWCDFQQTSFGDDEYGYLPEKHQVKIVRVYRDEAMILEVRKEVAFFHRDLLKMLEKLR
jgi:hypothetical protein